MRGVSSHLYRLTDMPCPCLIKCTTSWAYNVGDSRVIGLHCTTYYVSTQRMIYWDFPLCTHFSYDMKHAITSARQLASPNHASSQSSQNFWSTHEYLIYYQNKILVLIKWSYSAPHPPPQNSMLNVKPIMIGKFWACSRIYFKHVFFMASIPKATPNHIPLKYRCPKILLCWS